jgi:hypothetical protein
MSPRMDLNIIYSPFHRLGGHAMAEGCRPWTCLNKPAISCRSPVLLLLHSDGGEAGGREGGDKRRREEQEGSAAVVILIDNASSRIVKTAVIAVD